MNKKLLVIVALVTLVSSLVMASAVSANDLTHGRGQGGGQGGGYYATGTRLYRNAGSSPDFVDANGDGICDNYGTYPNFVDENGDGVCDLCGSGVPTSGGSTGGGYRGGR